MSEQEKKEQVTRDARRRMNQVEREVRVTRQIKMFVFGAVAIICIVIVSFIGKALSDQKERLEDDKNHVSQNDIDKDDSNKQTLFPEDPVPEELHFIAVGDNMIHERVGISGQSDTGVWSYEHLYQYVKDDIKAADLALVVQESIFVEDHDDFSGYPTFGTPTEVGDALVNTGFDIVAHATNHAMDKGADDVEFTVNWWKYTHPETTVLGIHENKVMAKEVKVIECNSFEIALLNYTEMLNGNPNMSGREHLVDVYDEDSVRKDIKRAKARAELVMVVMHAGTEYVSEVDEKTKAMTQVFLEEGVDIVIGSHPHVLRPMEMLTREDGHQMLVYYSLGNFISCQNGLSSLLGGMADITIKRDDAGKPFVASANMIPLMTHYNHDTKTYAVYKMEDYTQELLLNHSAYKIHQGAFSLDYYQNLFNSIIQ